MIEEVLLVKQVLEVTNDHALTMIDGHMTIFVDQHLAEMAQKGDLKETMWQKLLMSFVWKVQVQPELLKVLEEKQ